MGKRLELALGVLNGAIGDYLARTSNGLATPMTFVVDGEPVAPDRLTLSSRRVAILLHGLMCTEDVWEHEGGGDYGAFLARDLGFSPLYVRYNTGLAIPDNGAAFDALLDALVDAHEVDEILFVGYSMGGLVVRSACHFAGVAGKSWLGKVQRTIYVGTPHRGAPLERLGRFATRVLERIPDPYTRLIAQVGDLRSAGVKDLGDADLTHEHRAQRQPRWSLRDVRHPVPLLPTIRHYLIAGTLSDDPILAGLFGDTMVPVPSATNMPELIPKERMRVFSRIDHMGLAHNADVYEQIRAFASDSGEDP